MPALRKLRADVAELELVETPDPRPNVGEVLIEVAGAGICGTDLHIIDGTYVSNPPVTLGHEFAGRVVELGDGVDSSLLGRTVAVEPPVSCGVCEWCTRQLPMHCRERRSLGTSRDGGFATHVVVPARNLHLLPDSMAPFLGALVEPLACVCNGLLDPDVIAPGTRVVVIGPGPVGLLATQVAAALGADVTLVGLDRDSQRLGIASQMGLDARCLDTDGIRGELEHEGRDRRIHVVIECSGSAAGMQWGLSLPRPRGTHIQLGLLPAAAQTSFSGAVLSELQVRTSYGSTPVAWNRALELLTQGKIQLEPLVTAVRRLEEWRRAVADFEAGIGIKTLFDPQLG
ncbi:MAG: alcohol dehydrogenase catalytic domain-containing protein [Actinomycetes bacterium]